MGRREEVAVFSSSSPPRPPGMKRSTFLSTIVANADWCACGGGGYLVYAVGGLVAFTLTF